MVVALLPAGCATVAPMPVRGPPTASIMVSERGWHTDVCLRAADADVWVAALARRFVGARFLCMGFGDRHYLVTRDAGMFSMLTALVPGSGALLLTVLNDTPAAAFGANQVVALGVTGEGLAGLNGFLRRSVETGAAGAPVWLGDGPYPGSVFLGATPTYSGLYTCNTWTADALRAAGVKVSGAVVFAGNLMHEARHAAAAQAAAGRAGGG